MPLTGTLQNFAGTFLSDELRATLRQGGKSLLDAEFPKFGGSLDDEATFSWLLDQMPDGNRKALEELWIPMLGPQGNRRKQMIKTIDAMTKVKLPAGIDAKTINIEVLRKMQDEVDARALRTLNHLAELPFENVSQTELQRLVDEGQDRKTRVAVARQLMRPRESDYWAETLRTTLGGLTELGSAADQAALDAEEEELRRQLAAVRASRGPMAARLPLTLRQRHSYFSLTGRHDDRPSRLAALGSWFDSLSSRSRTIVIVLGVLVVVAIIIALW
jgi:hypothetical protein